MNNFLLSLCCLFSSYQEDFGAYLREYVAGNISYLQASEFEEMFGTLRDALWSSIVAAFCNLINKCQVYFPALTVQIWIFKNQ